jgi:hypothetical protein
MDEGNGEFIRKTGVSIADRWGPDLIAFVAGQFWRCLGSWKVGEFGHRDIADGLE